ncbi:diacylglycerol kinase family lipid kinase [Salipaludibacillus agaradhaerens]|uniref:diacylglycerol/lipid kinase family protein n=1 Tax=Salipaludibacillus agaradhaerens TaxID=76935 RepID=UPI002150FD09|nr:diacylglycerol kinase family protein [Salipaludibacillus agaradhaerens]MCR6105800.1 diacylglycerol kinase family lipid kinase [Salipaludibacillus agaradhaerens]MCR6117836.1 diacylglycerol kinase family lipid kinase [Salipaludibacillus agaradhaerens]UJW57000.1 diacylglycerol kinase family lipid kinase [Bacillus sp. A116_S68]
MLKKALLLCNDKAGQGDVQKNIGIAAGILTEKVDDLTIRKGKKKGDLEEMCRKLDSEIELLIIMGGDGTVHECVNGLNELTAPPLIAIIPTGTCNDFARALNLPLTVAEAAIVAINGQKQKIDTGRVNDRTFTNFAGTGLIVDTSENINEETKALTGPLSYLISAVKTASDSRSFHYEIVIDGETMNGEAVLITVVNGRFIGTYELPFHNLSVQDGHLNVFLVKEGGLAVFKEWIQRKAFDALPDETTVIAKTAKTITLKTTETEKVDTDGDVYLQTPIEISIGRPFTFMTDATSL